VEVVVRESSPCVGELPTRRGERETVHLHGDGLGKEGMTMHKDD
jgi:hypothetical protein